MSYPQQFRTQGAKIDELFKSGLRKAGTVLEKITKNTVFYVKNVDLKKSVSMSYKFSRCRYLISSYVAKAVVAMLPCNNFIVILIYENLFFSN
jgi:hypothetical protein